MSTSEPFPAELELEAPLRPQSAWQAIQDALRDLQFGEVTIIVQDGAIVQVERTEKRRLRSKPVT